MTPDAFFTPKQGQSLLIPGQAEAFKGQCVQSVGLWVEALGLKMPVHPFAYLFYDDGIPGFDKIPHGQPILEGDIIIWGPNFPSSPNAGHIDVASADGTITDFYGWDSNWSPPLKLNKIHHTGVANNYISGYLRRQGGEPMVNRGDIVNVYRKAIGRDPNDNDFAAWDGKDWKDFIYDLIQRPDFVGNKPANDAQDKLNKIKSIVET